MANANVSNNGNKDADARRASAAAAPTKKYRRTAKEQLGALLTATTLGKDEFVSGGYSAGHVIRLDDGNGLFAEFIVNNIDEQKVLCLGKSNSPLLQTFIGGNDDRLNTVFIKPYQVSLPEFVSRLTGVAADKQDEMIHFIKSCLTEDERRLVGKPVVKTVVESQGNDDNLIKFSDLLACMEGKARYDLDEGEYLIFAGFRNTANEFQVKLIYASCNAGDWKKYTGLFVSLRALQDRPGSFNEYTTPTDLSNDETSQKRDKAQYLGKALLAIIANKGFKITVPEKKDSADMFVDETNIAGFWGKATPDVNKALQNALDGEYNGNTGFLRFGEKPSEGVVFEVSFGKNTLWSFTFKPVMVGNKNGLADKIHSGTFLKAPNFQLPESLDDIPETLGSHREEVQNILRFFFVDGHAVVDALFTAKKAVEEKRTTETARSNARKIAQQKQVTAEVTPLPMPAPTPAVNPQVVTEAKSTPTAKVETMDSLLLDMIANMNPTQLAEFATRRNQLLNEQGKKQAAA